MLHNWNCKFHAYNTQYEIHIHALPLCLINIQESEDATANTLSESQISISIPCVTNKELN